jgi:hypothetical protein
MSFGKTFCRYFSGAGFRFPALGFWAALSFAADLCEFRAGKTITAKAAKWLGGVERELTLPFMDFSLYAQG